MMKNAKKIILLFCLTLYLKGSSQNFNYQFNAGSSTYNELSSPTYLAQNGSWIESHVKIPIGFSFDYLGQTFDSVSVFNNGYLVFDNNFNYGFAAFTLNLSGVQNDQHNEISSVSYDVEGSVGSRILKIQFANCGIQGESGGYVNYQVWVAESSRAVSLHVGTTTYSADVLTGYSKVAGLINMNKLEAGTTGLLVSGDADSPSSGTINETDKRLKLTGFPSANKVYTFTPNF